MRRALFHEIWARLARGLGRERLFPLMLRWHLRALSYGRDKAVAQTVLRRVLRFSGTEPSPEDLRRLVAELAWIYTDGQATFHLLDPADKAGLLARVDFDLLPEIKRLRAQGKGVILASPHFGNIVLAVAALGLKGVPMNVMLINGGIYDWLRPYGIKPIALGTGAMDSVRALAAGEVVTTFCDLDFFPGNRAAPFFGAPARPPHGVIRLAQSTGAPILPFYTVHRGGGRYKLIHDEAIAPSDGSAEKLEDKLLRSMERNIALHPSHWYVMRDLWNLEECDRLSRRHLEILARNKRLKSLLGS